MFANINIGTIPFWFWALGLSGLTIILIFLYLYFRINRLKRKYYTLDQQKKDQQIISIELEKIKIELKKINSYLPQLIRAEILDFLKSEIPNHVKLQIIEITDLHLDSILEGKRHYIQKITESAIKDCLNTELMPKLEEFVSQELPKVTTKSLEIALSNEIQKRLPDLVKSYIKEHSDPAIRKIFREETATITSKSNLPFSTIECSDNKELPRIKQLLDIKKKVEEINEMKSSVAASSPVPAKQDY